MFIDGQSTVEHESKDLNLLLAVVADHVDPFTKEFDPDSVRGDKRRVGLENDPFPRSERIALVSLRCEDAQASVDGGLNGKLKYDVNSLDY